VVEMISINRIRTSEFDVQLYMKLLPIEREALDSLQLAEKLIMEGDDRFRRQALICLDNSVELLLKGFLVRRGLPKCEINRIGRFHQLLRTCIKLGLKLDDIDQKNLLELHMIRNDLYHGKRLLVPTLRDLRIWIEFVKSLVLSTLAIER